MLFNKRTKKVIQWTFGSLAVLMAVSMVLAYSGVGSIAATTAQQPLQTGPSTAATTTAVPPLQQTAHLVTPTTTSL